MSRLGEVVRRGRCLVIRSLGSLVRRKEEAEDGEVQQNE
jgi:hypothetical protein